MENSTQEIVISCLCGKHQHTWALPASIKALSYGICHCNSCRKSSGGSLYQGSIEWPFSLIRVSGTDQIPDGPKTFLQQYEFGSSLHVWFCETCSTKLYWQYLKDAPKFELFPGLLPETLVESGQISLSCNLQIHIADTLDEGLSSCFFGLDGEIGLRYQGGRDSPSYIAQERHKAPPALPAIVEGECHCGQSTLKLSSRSGAKFPVELDTSKESQLLNSTDISAWALVSPEDIISVNNMPLHILEKLKSNTKDGVIGPLGVYTTDKTVIFFCNKCSASVLTQPLQPTKTSVLKVGASLLNSQAGARKEDILDWSEVQPVVLEHHNIRLDPRNF